MRLSDIYWCIRKGFPLRSLICCDLNYHVLPRSTTIPHPYGITVGHGTTVGEDCCIAPNVTIGARIIRYYTKIGWRAIKQGIRQEIGLNGEVKIPVDYCGYTAPKIGNRVYLGAGSIILGDVEIPDDVIVAAGSVVISPIHIERGNTIAGVPAKVIK
jgi:serine acetyltransferase